ncbi:MAG: LCP family protein [Candidatus Doudnabacteria bacterium]|nr:LCP family protein [Candidatus Doudnabacteria bacterium]MCA9387915.1 LCP family protein [Candidatus Andersenbacteria bacterium]
MFKLLLKILGVLVLVLLVGAVVLFLFAPNRFNVLVIGSDQRGTERARSDVMFIFSLAKWPSDRTSLITIPRDSRVDIPGHGIDKLTHAYAYGEVEEGSVLGNKDLTTVSIENVLDIQIDGTIEVTFDSFVSIVDALGGVDHSTEGHLDGEAALAQVRDRYRPGGDFARTSDQRELFRALLTKVRSGGNPQMLYRLSQEDPQIRVDIPEQKFLWFGYGFFIAHGGKLSLGEVYDEALPGKGETLFAPAFGQNLYFWVLDEQKTAELVEMHLR